MVGAYGSTGAAGRRFTTAARPRPRSALQVPALASIRRGWANLTVRASTRVEAWCRSPAWTTPRPEPPPKSGGPRGSHTVVCALQSSCPGPSWPRKIPAASSWRVSTRRCVLPRSGRRCAPRGPGALRPSGGLSGSNPHCPPALFLVRSCGQAALAGAGVPDPWLLALARGLLLLGGSLLSARSRRCRKQPTFGRASTAAKAQGGSSSPSISKALPRKALPAPSARHLRKDRITTRDGGTRHKRALRGPSTPNREGLR